MSRKTLPIFALTACLGLSACGGDTTTKSSRAPVTSSTDKPAQARTTVGSKNHKVALKNQMFIPARLTIKAGDTVTWKWHENFILHNVTSIGKPSFKSSGELINVDTHKVTFKKPGVYRYHCEIHKHMYGVIIVK